GPDPVLRRAAITRVVRGRDQSVDVHTHRRDAVRVVRRAQQLHRRRAGVVGRHHAHTALDSGPGTGVSFRGGHEAAEGVGTGARRAGGPYDERTVLRRRDLVAVGAGAAPFHVILVTERLRIQDAGGVVERVAD